jgi:soluble lytic murein transglycosylase-like protein
MAMMANDLIAAAREAASQHALDPALVCAVIEQESAWDPHAIRYEAGFRTRYVAPLHLPASEEIARSISSGLMQVMGQVAREHGFTGKFLSALCEPGNGIELGCRVLAAKLSSASGDVNHGLALWNGGANLDYAAQVLARLAAYQ